MSNRAHWNHIYQTKERNEVSWYAPHLTRSLSFITNAAPHKHAEIIDVGAGESTLIEDLLASGYTNLNYLDISDEAVSATRDRLGTSGQSVQWYVGDVTSIALPADRFDVWHDRAVFHFLLETGQRKAYVAQLQRSVKVGGQVIIATFAQDGPVQCSGLPIVRYTAEALSLILGEEFNLVGQVDEEHCTPAGKVQKFIYCRFRRM